MKINWEIINKVLIILLYISISTISTIHLIDFFKLGNNLWMSTVLAISFEIGALASLSALFILAKANKQLIVSIFLSLTAIQLMGNMYYSYINLDTDYINKWFELFWLSDSPEITKKRILAAVLGIPLPLIALGFIKSLIDYIAPSKRISTTPDENHITNATEKKPYIQVSDIIESVNDDKKYDDSAVSSSDVKNNIINNIEESNKSNDDYFISIKRNSELDKSVKQILNEYDADEEVKTKIWNLYSNENVLPEKFIDYIKNRKKIHINNA
jgi:hypothetical protein